MVEGQEGVDWESWLALARAAEAAGLDGFFRSDHYRSIDRGDPNGSLEAWATLAAIAASTERIRLGTLVSPVTFRHPSVLAKSVVTVDHISSGRVELGIGAGWFEAEHVAYGFPFMTARERADELDRQLGEIRRQWEDSDTVWPKPIQKPHPPIIVGGKAMPRTVRAAVAFADEYNTFAKSPAEAAERARIVADGARAAGRPPLRFSVGIGCVVGRDEDEVIERIDAWKKVARNFEAPTLSGTVEQLVERLRGFERAGVDRVMLQNLVYEDVEMVSLLGELARALAT